MREYYFLASLLPPLEIGHVPSLGFFELKDLLTINLAEEDFEKTRTFLRLIDFENFRHFWAKEPLNPRGNVKKEEMEHVLSEQRWPNEEEFPIYLKDFLDRYRTPSERLAHFQLLMSQFFLHESENQTGFLRDYFQFQRDIQLVMVGFRAKKLGRDISKELQYEDSTDPIVAEILAQKDAKTYEPPFEYKELKPIFDEFGDSPLELHKALYQYEFRTIVELLGGELFNIDRILNYMARLLLVERWLDLDVQQGMQMIDTIERDVR